jgi:hypothetical protein
VTITNDDVLTAPAGLFLARFEVGGELPGAPLLHLAFTVYTPGRTVTGLGRLTQAVNPPLDVASRLGGDYTYLTVMPNESTLLVTATGYPVVEAPADAGILPVLPPNLTLRMVLDKDWQSGVANYSYLSGGAWHEVTDAPVKQVG